MNIDQTVLDFFVSHRVEWMTFIMVAVTYLGNITMIIVLSSLSVVSFFIHKHYARIIPLLITIAGSAFTTYFIKYSFALSRPPIGSMLYPDISPSFPSGHATIAVALYGFLLYTIWKHEHTPLKKLLLAFLFAAIILIGISRLYLGAHYLSDVLAGYTVGLLWLFIGIKIHKKLLRLSGIFGPH